jgi:hypothetical protein
MSTTDEEQRAWRRIRREERGISTPEENQALEWLATRLRRLDVVLPGKISDWDVAASWESRHWPKLKTALQPIDARDHAAIDRTFEQYQRDNGLLIDVTPAPADQPRLPDPRKFLLNSALEQ